MSETNEFKKNKKKSRRKGKKKYIIQNIDSPNQVEEKVFEQEFKKEDFHSSSEKNLDSSPNIQLSNTDSNEDKFQDAPVSKFEKNEDLKKIQEEKYKEEGKEISEELKENKIEKIEEKVIAKVNTDTG